MANLKHKDWDVSRKMVQTLSKLCNEFALLISFLQSLKENSTSHQWFALLSNRSLESSRKTLLQSDIRITIQYCHTVNIFYLENLSRNFFAPIFASSQKALHFRWTNEFLIFLSHHWVNFIKRLMTHCQHWCWSDSELIFSIASLQCVQFLSWVEAETCSTGK